MLTLRSNIDATIKRTLDRMKEIQPGGEVFDKAIHEAADTHLHSCVERIHSSCMASDGSDIGQYSTTPMYVNPAKTSSSFQPVGKTGRTTFIKSGQPHLTKYFDEGYRAFRQEIGLASDKVILTLRGKLRNGLITMPVTNGYAISWADPELQELSEALEKKYAKPIWSATNEEKEKIVKGLSEKLKMGAG